jgi:hypothetical protein
MKYLLIALFIIFLIGCSVYDTTQNTYVTFESVSKPYRDKYGPPEDEYKYNSSSYNSVNWWWWSKGFNVTFVESIYDDVYGWTVDSTYSFTPF